MQTSTQKVVRPDAPGSDNRYAAGLAEEPQADPLDRMLHAMQAEFSGSLSPASLMLAWLDWSLHLANAPGRRMALARAAMRNALRLADPGTPIFPAAQDRRFRAREWHHPPFNILAQSFLLTEDWWRQATQPLPGVTRAHSNVVAFAARQALDIFSPGNFSWSNPEVLNAAWSQGGANFLRGGLNWLDDLSQLAKSEPFQEVSDLDVGKDVAVTPGKVVFRDALMELIQYAPASGVVHPEPILIVPAWIMKYYILDLSPQNSFIRYLVGQGFTVFCISWKNPGPELRDTGFDDYRREGVLAALAAVEDICGGAAVHACGYCLGGTLLAVAAAGMARDGDARLKSVTLLAAQTDFTEAGELQLFTDESQLALLDDMMWRQGYLDSRHMAGAFQMLRSNDLIWSRVIKTYLLGAREKASDLMAWNADTTRMPYRMHSEYLHSMFLKNDLAEGRCQVDGKPIAVSDIEAPLFAVGTETDHVAPWRSVYKIHLLNRGDVTFVLTTGGHNAGVVSEPGHPRRHYHIAHRQAGKPYLSPEDWYAAAPEQEGSWWPAYTAWLRSHSGPAAPPPAMGSTRHPAQADAPGLYVRET